MKFFNYSFDSPPIWDYSISHRASFLKSWAFDNFESFSAGKFKVSFSLCSVFFFGFPLSVIPCSLIFCIIFRVRPFILFWMVGRLYPNSSYDPWVNENVGSSCSSEPPSSIFSFNFSSLDYCNVEDAWFVATFKVRSLGTEPRLYKLPSLICGNLEVELSKSGLL